MILKQTNFFMINIFIIIPNNNRQTCALPVHVMILLRKECCQPFVENSGCFANSITCCEYQWSEGGHFEFLDTLLIGAAPLLLVSMVGSCQQVRLVDWGAQVEYPKPLAPMSNLASSP